MQPRTNTSPHVKEKAEGSNSGQYPRWGDVELVADASGYSKSTLNKLRTYGGGPPFYKAEGSNKVRYKMSEVMEWVAAQRRGSTAEYDTWQRPGKARAAETPETVAS